MNLRNVTIWTTGLMLIGTIAVPVVVMVCSVYAMHDRFQLIFGSWLFSSTPLLVSLVLAKILRYWISTVMLLISTITYVTWFAIVLSPVSWFIMTSGQSGPEGMAFIIVGMLSLWVMIPVWITAIVLNWRYAKKALQPETAVASSLPPDEKHDRIAEP